MFKFLVMKKIEYFSNEIQKKIVSFENRSMKTKLLVLFLSLALFPLFFSTLITFNESRVALEKDLKLAEGAIKKEVFSQLRAVRDTKRLALETDLRFMHEQIRFFAKDLMVIEAMKSFSFSIAKILEEISTEEGSSKSIDYIRAFYRQEWAAKYKQTNNSKQPDLDAYIAKLSKETLTIQSLYIPKNKVRQNNSSYERVHRHYDHVFRDYLDRFGYYDIFFVDVKTNQIVYSVSKQIEFASSLTTGPLVGTHLWQVYQDSLILKESQTAIVDLQPYFPAYDAPSGFIATPIFQNNKKIGVVIFTIPIQRINAIMTARSGLGKTGETYLVGPDYLMRSDTYLDKIYHSVNGSFLDQEKGQVDSIAVKSALEGKKSEKILKNYKNDDVLSAFSPVKIGGLTWALLAEINLKEAFSAIKNMEIQANQQKTRVLFFGFLVIAFSAILIIGLSLWLSSLISRPLKETVKVLKAVSEGDLSQRLSIQTDDEIGVMARALNQALFEISKTMNVISENSRVLTNAAVYLQKMGFQMTQSADNTSEKIQFMRNAYENVDLGIQGVSSAADEMVISIQNISDNSSIANEIAISGVDQSILTQNTIKTLNVSSREISKVTSLIENIAHQTNMLAMNAKIEAVHAGEKGLGFSIVALEVKNLAKETAKFAIEIGHKVKSIQSETIAAEQEIGDIGGVITKINDTQSIIAQAVQEQILSTTEISHNIDNVVKESRNMQNNIVFVEEGLKDTQKIASLLKEEAEKLTQMADSLTHLIGKFTILERE